MNANIEVTNQGCDFDLGDRSLSFQKTLQMTGLGFIKVRNASSITVTANGKFKVRGDFVQPNGFIIGGGLVWLETSGTITFGGMIDVSGDPAGSVLIAGGGNVTLQNGSLVQGNGITSFVSGGDRFSDGGTVEIRSGSGSISINDEIILVGTRHGAGGSLLLEAPQNVTINGVVDASGGESDGGDVTVVAGDDINVTRMINVESAGGGGFGGIIDLTSGVDSLGGVVTGGSSTITGSVMKLNGSAAQGSGGDGGALFITSSGDIRLTGNGVAVQASAGAGADGLGGLVILDSTDLDDTTIGSLDGDVLVDGVVNGQGGGAGGVGGDLGLFAGRNLTVNASVTVTGEDSGGTVQGNAGGTAALNGTISAEATHGTGQGGAVDVRAGFAQSASLTVTKDINVSSGANSSSAESIVLSACSLTIGNSVKLDGRGGVAGGALIQLMARTPMQLNTDSMYLAGPGGATQTIHPPGQNPVIGSNVVFNPARTDVTSTTAPYQPCGL
jgi:hypothetical protein